ncbi:nuclear transport factor 2 family protein [Blastococcus deserti]|uniref:Nuclear transport factor 2 family protein n=1 Tax=Blastococcus deserti TaxID=2259033 RepID=A0ABW4X8N1_9ACTN
MESKAQRDDDARRAIEHRLVDILDAVHAGDVQRLASYHLDSPRFTKFNDSPPLERQDFATAMSAEAAEFQALDEIRGAFEDVKIDLFGAVAVVTGLFAYEASVGDDRSSGTVRTTAVMVDDAGDWKIAHEHLSVLPAPA